MSKLPICNVGPNHYEVFGIGTFDLYFSYCTLIAFRHHDKLFVRENQWGPTTGKHLNAIDGGRKQARLTTEAFETAFADCCNAIHDESRGLHVN